jgi:alkanesulfonate monooxygenase SsuD/methylene tetrahydromethanopterin reductase-like flavin-dependent oxidoreductase (luciferase family)
MAAWQDDLQFYAFHFMPYTDLPEDQAKYDSLWVDFPNRHFNPEKGHEFYNTYMSQMVLADKLGYDGLVVNEHHNTVYSMMPVCTLMAAALIPQTRQAKICCFGVPLNLEMPHRVAEAYGMLDVMSGGRVEIALPLGTGMEYWANSVNPANARARFREAIDVLIQAWTVPGPSTFAGEFFNYRDLNVWPQQMQKPHPKIAIVGTGSPETIEIAASRGWAYDSVFVPITQQLKTFRAMSEQFAKYGHTATPDKRMMNVICYVAETDEQAERESREHIEFYFNNNLRTTPRYLAPPGYMSAEQLRLRAAAAKSHGSFDWDIMTQQWRVVCGSPAKVTDTIGKWCEDADSSRILLHQHLGNMPNWKVVKNMSLFAEQVIPQLRNGMAVSRRPPAMAAE